MTKREEYIGKLFRYFLSQGFEDYKRGWITGPCPECGESRIGKYALHLEENRGNCFICGNKEKPLKVIMRMENLKTEQEVFQKIKLYKPASYYREDKPHKKEYKEKIPKGITLPEDFKLVGIYNNKYAKIVESNLKNRGFSINRLMRKGVGYCTKGEYAHRIIIPYFENGKLTYFNARRIVELGTKFKNPQVEHLGIGKSHIIYNIDALYMYDKIYLFESATNALTVGDNATATGGKILSPWQINQYIKSSAKKIIIGLDDDAYKESLQLALKLVLYKEVKVLKFPKGLDVNKLGKAKTKELEKNTPYQSYKDILNELNRERAFNSY